MQLPTIIFTTESGSSYMIDGSTLTRANSSSPVIDRRDGEADTRRVISWELDTSRDFEVVVGERADIPVLDNLGHFAGFITTTPVKDGFALI